VLAFDNIFHYVAGRIDVEFKNLPDNASGRLTTCVVRLVFTD
jgi:hypothetical protein